MSAGAVVVLGLALCAAPAEAGGESLLEYVRGRTDLEAGERAAWELAVKRKFGGAALDEDSAENPQIAVAKAILAAAIFERRDPKAAALAAFEGYRGALGYVPPPLAIHYQLLVLEGRKPEGSMEDLTFDFPRHYVEELAPEMVAFWERSLADGTCPDYLVEETKDALARTKRRMRPLLADKLLVLKGLKAELSAAPREQVAAIEADVADVEAELERSFRGVVDRPEILDRARPADERYDLLIEELGRLGAEEDDRGLAAELERIAAREAAEAAEAERAEAAAREAEAAARRAEEDRRRAEAEAKRAIEEARRADAARRAEAERARRAAEAAEAEGRARAEAEARAAEVARRRADEEARERAESARRAEAERQRVRAEEARAEAERRRVLAEAEAARRATPKALRPDEIAPKLERTIGPWLGTPYLWGGTEKRTGTDCSGFTKGVHREGFHVELPRVSRDQAKTGRRVDADGLAPGDLVFFDTKDVGHVNHVGVYAGGGRFAHASSTRGVVYDELGKAYYQRAYRGARRVIGR